MSEDTAAPNARVGELSADEWQSVLAAVSEGVVVHAADGAIVSVNEAACRIIGLTREQLLGLDPLDPRWQATEPDGTPIAGEDHPAMVTLRTGEPMDDRIMSVSLPVGGRRWIRVSSRLLAGAPPRVVATFVDVTEERERELRYQTLAESTSDIVARVDDSAVSYASPAAEATLGPLRGRNARDIAATIAHPDDLSTFLSTMDRISNGEVASEHLDMRLRTIDGSWIWSDVRVWRIAGSSSVVVVARDITDRKSMERELADAEELFRQAFDEAPIGMAMTSVESPARVVRANWRYAEAVGIPADRIVGMPTSAFTHPDDHGASIAARQRLLEGTTTHDRMHVRIPRPDGTAPWHVLTRTLLRDQAGEPRFILAQIEDAGVAQDIVTKLARLAHTDPLTGLLNRRGLDAELEAVLADPFAASHAALFFLDLDGFKAVNDHLGHAAGDDVLRGVADRLTQLTRSHDTVARVGGDEFVVVARHLASVEATRLVADRLAGVLVDVPGVGAVRASVGVTRLRLGADVETVLAAADRDMYREKVARAGAAETDVASDALP